MREAFALLEPNANRDDDGRTILGDPTKGCRHCGDIAIKVAENDRLVLYHPGVECCQNAIDDQLRFRQGDLNELQKQITAKETALELLREETRMYDPNTKDKEATKAFYRVDVAERNYNASLSAIKVQIRELSEEMARLRLKREELTEGVIKR